MTDTPSAPFTLRTLHDSGTDFRALIEHSADLITLLDRQGHILYQSPSAQQHFGCDRNPQTGHYHTTLDYLHPDDRDRIVQQILHLPVGVTLTLSPYRIQHAYGRWCWLEGTATNMTDHPQVQGILIQSRDVTVRVHAEQRARALEGLSTALARTKTTAEVVQVILLQGLEAMGAFAGGVLCSTTIGSR